jgi:Ca2+-binding EF-hand superfamily protein
MSNHQEVVMEGGKMHYDYTWTAQKVATRQYQPEGGPVLAGAEIILTHNATRAPLAADKAFPMGTDFGGEYEVACHQYLARGKALTMIHESKGICTPDVRQRAELPQNRWVFRTAERPEEAEDTRSFVQMTKDGILTKIKSLIRERGNTGIRALGRLFRIIDDRGNGLLDREEFRYGLQDFGIALTDEEFGLVMDQFDRNGDGVISFDEFLVTIADPPNDYRKSLINAAFDKLDNTKDGQVTIEDVQNRYDAKGHPDVVSGRKTEKEVLEGFMSLWDTQNKDGVVTRSEFTQYYSEISAGIEDDDYFANMIGAAWGL